MTLWVAFTTPLCAIVFYYFQSQSRAESAAKRTAQELVLSEVFERNARFGDIVNAKAEISTMGEAFGLGGFFVCREGFDVIGELSRVPCPNFGNRYTTKVAGEELELRFRWQEPRLIDPLLLKAIGITGLSSLVVFLVVMGIVYYVLRIKVRSLSRAISVSGRPEDVRSLNPEITEFRPILEAFASLQSRIDEDALQIATLKTASALSDQARQVAHDIRSPLSALRIATSRISASPEASALISSAVRRIEKIASDLLIDNSSSTVANSLIGSKFFHELIKIKSIEFGDNAVINYSGSIENDIHIPIPEISLFRCISNILNNSAEALVTTREIHVRSGVTDGNLAVEIQDFGRGICQELLSRLGRDAVSSGKSGSGTGIGLMSVFQIVESVGGTVQIRSELGRGTTVNLNIPCREPVR